MEYQQIRFDVAEGVATLTLNRPERLNAFTGRMGAEWGDALARCDEDDEVRAVIITGAGRAFCAGADLSRGKDAFQGAGRERVKPEREPLQPWQVRKPVVAAMNGHAIGIGHPHPWTFEALRDNLDYLEAAGVELVTVCDIVGAPAGTP